VLAFIFVHCNRMKKSDMPRHPSVDVYQHMS